MKRNEPIAHIMSRNPRSVQVNARPSEVRVLLQDGSFHHLPVVEGTRLVGLISSADLLRLSFGGTMSTDARSWDAVMDHTYSLSQIMHHDLITLDLTSTVRDAAEKLSSGTYHAIPVVDKGELVGIVTSTDLIRYLLEQY